MLDHVIREKSQSDRHGIQYVSGGAALVQISLRSDGNIQLTRVMGANTVDRIKADCV
jgi:hypothetical protein